MRPSTAPAPVRGLAGVAISTGTKTAREQETESKRVHAYKAVLFLLAKPRLFSCMAKGY